MQLLDVPYMHAKVRGRFVGTVDDVECYIFGLTVILNRPLLFTAHLTNGAVFSRLPLKAFYRYDTLAPPLEHSECWGAIGHHASVIQHKYLKDYRVKTAAGDARYLYTIDFFDGGYSEDPEQHKTANVVELFYGNYLALPNNECLFEDAHFFRKSDLKLQRNQTYFLDRNSR
jgi:hypothetical protein